MSGARRLIDRWISKDTQTFLVFLFILIGIMFFIILTYFAIFVIKWGK
jgi:hypothetical protein